MKIDDKIICYCIPCVRNTNHTVKAVIDIEGSFEYQVNMYYGIVQCNGCDGVSYLTETEDYESMHYDEFDDDWQPSIGRSAYPETLKYHRKTIETYRLPQRIGVVYTEALKAFAGKCYLLTAVAFRTIIEAVCMDKGIKVKEFEDLKPQIDKLNKNGFITKIEAERLHAIRFLGNDSVHEMTTVKENDLMIVLDVIEHLIKNLYVIDAQIRESKLETVISDFEGFKKLLNIRLNKLNIGDSVSLKTILGKSARRLADDGDKLESELVNKINDGSYLKLSLGALVPHQDTKKPHVQYYEVLQNKFDNNDLWF